MGNSTISSGSSARAICDRCRMTQPYTYLRQDGQSPGLQVCPECWDRLTTYALPPLQPDNLVLRKPRPLTHLVAYQYQNVPVYEGGPISVGPPDTYTSSFPDMNQTPYPPGYVPDTVSMTSMGGYGSSGSEDVHSPHFIPPVFPPE